MPIPYSCGLCRGALRKHFFTAPKYVKHLEFAHQHEANFLVTCGISGCRKQYKKIDSFKKHILRCHTNVWRRQVPEVADVEAGEFLAADDLVDDMNFEGHESDNNDEDNENTVEDLSRSLSLMTLKLREKHVVPAVVTEDVCHTMKGILLSYLEKSSKVQQEHEPGAHGDSHAELMHSVNRGFQAVSTEYQLSQYCLTHLNMVLPIEIVLGRAENGKKHSIQYVPILQVLKQVLRNNDIAAHILQREHFKTSTDLMFDYCDGQLFKDHPVFSRVSDFPKLRLHFYIDEFEVANPLGSKRGEYKQSAVYFTIGNMHPRYRSRLENVYLCILVKYKYVKTYGYSNIFKPLIKDLNLLKNAGIEISLHGEKLTFKGTIATLSGDNLSAHDVGGFQVHFNAGRICRFCMCSKEDICNKTTEEDVVLRTKEVHDYHLQAVQDNETNVRIYGVKGPCALNAVESFEVTECLPPDVMHDCLEGVFTFVIKVVLKELVTSKVLTIQTINSRILHMVFGQNDLRNKPSCVKENMLRNSISGKASEKWCLFRLLPQLIGHMVPVGNDVWKMYLLCREIAEYIMAPAVRKSWLAYLSNLIAEFLEMIADYVEEHGCPCKLHYIMHYPRLMLMYGPLIHLWCMRYEAQHQYFKRLASVIFNFKNISASLAKRHQQRQCWELNSKSILGETTQRSGTIVNFDSLPAGLQLCFNEKVASISMGYNGDTLWKFTKLEKDNVKYEEEDCFVVDLLHEEEIPLFVQVKYILNYRELWFICSCLLMPEAFEDHFQAYRVTPTTDWLIFSPGQEADHHALDVYQNPVTKSHYIPLRYKITRNS